MLVRKPEGKDKLEDLGANERILFFFFTRRWFNGAFIPRLQSFDDGMTGESERICKAAAAGNRGTVQKFACRDWRKPRKIWARISGVTAEVRTEHLSSTSLERYL
jgi:hypothetical protein